MALSLRLDPETEERLNFLATETGRTKTFYVKKLIEDYLEDLEDIYLGELALSDLKQGKEKLVDLADIEKKLNEMED